MRGEDLDSVRSEYSGDGGGGWCHRAPLLVGGKLLINLKNILLIRENWFSGAPDKWFYYKIHSMTPSVHEDIKTWFTGTELFRNVGLVIHLWETGGGHPAGVKSYLSFCFSNFVSLVFTLTYICGLNCNQRTLEGIKLQRWWWLALLRTNKMTSLSSNNGPFSQVTLTSWVPPEEWADSWDCAFPLLCPSIPPNIQNISAGVFLLEFLSRLYKGRAVRDHFLIILISLLVWR